MVLFQSGFSLEIPDGVMGVLVVPTRWSPFRQCQMAGFFQKRLDFGHVGSMVVGSRRADRSVQSIGAVAKKFRQASPIFPCSLERVIAGVAILLL